MADLPEISTEEWRECVSSYELISDVNDHFFLPLLLSISKGTIYHSCILL